MRLSYSDPQAGGRDKGEHVMRLPGFVVRTRRRDAGAVIPPHAHETTNLGLCVEGSFLETLGRRRVAMTPATLIGRPAGEIHENRFGSVPARYITIEFSAHDASQFRPVTDVLDRSFVRESAFVTAVARRVHRELRRPDSVSQLVIESLVHELIAEAHRTRELRSESRQRAGWLDRVVEVLREAGDDSRRIGLSELAARVAVHPSHLARVFRREFGCSVGEYVRTVRLDEASRLLHTTRLDLAAIALATGFSDQSHFSTAFRRRFGMTPSQFRRASRTS